MMKRWIRWQIGGLLACVWMVSGWGTAAAQTSSFDSSAAVTYGLNVQFFLSGNVASEISQATLFLSSAQFATPLSVDLRFTQVDGRLDTSYRLDPSLVNLAPFSEVHYWWELTTAASQTIVVPEKTFIYQDDRFEWRVFSEGDVTVYWTGNEEKFGSLAANITAESRQLLDRILPQTAVSPLNLYIYPDTNVLRAGLRLGGRTWQNGHTDPDLGVLLLTAVNRNTAEADLRRSIPHELAHLRLYQLAPTVQWPIWYEEGIALLAEEDEISGRDLLKAAVSNDTTLPLLALCTAFPATEPDNDLALAESVSLLRYIQAQFGDQALRQLGAVYQSRVGCVEGLEKTLDTSLVELNVDWLHAQQPQPSWLTFLSQNGLWLLLVLGSFGLMALLAKR